MEINEKKLTNLIQLHWSLLVCFFSRKMFALTIKINLPVNLADSGCLFGAKPFVVSGSFIRVITERGDLNRWRGLLV